MDSQDHKNYKRAKSLAAWSYIGILNPILGLVLGGVSKSILNDLPENDRTERTRKSATGGIVVSAVFFAMFTFFGGLLGIAVADQSSKPYYEPSYVQGLEKKNDAAMEVIKQLSSQYNSLVNQYNQLGSTQAKRPIVCNTTNFDALNSASTVCY